MAMAVQKLFPKAQVTIGPWTETGFYYDFDVPEPFTDGRLIFFPRSESGRFL
jgi:threonyl-tRNA synthetase